MNNTRIYWLLLILAALTACSRSAPVARESFDPNAYIVQTGDTVYSISWRYAQDFRDVIKWNRLQDPYIIFPGQKLIVRQPDGSDSTVVAVSQQRTEQESEPTAKTQPLKKKTPSVTQKKSPGSTAKSIEKVAAQPAGWSWPVKGKLLGKYVKNSLDRQGIDIQGIEGAPVLAARGGRVVYSGAGMLSYGRLVIIKHSETFLSAYAHNSQLLVKEGDSVNSRQPIAKVGTSNQGIAKLHFEIRKNGKPVNPLTYLPSN